MRPIEALPEVSVLVDHDPVPRALLASLGSVRVARELSLPAQCQVAFALDGTPATASADLLRRAALGCRLEVRVQGDARTLFAGDITAHEWDHRPDGGAELRVRAYDELHRLRKRQRVTVRDRVTLADVVAELAGEAGLGVEVSPSAARWPMLVQHAGSDLDLITDLARDAGLYVVVDGDTLQVIDLAGHGDPVELELHRSLLSARFETNTDPACRSVSASGWDPVTAEALVGQATEARSIRLPARRTAPDAVRADGERYITAQHGPAGDHLDGAAQAELDRRVAREVTMVAVAAGDAAIVPGRRVRVAGVAEPVAGDYVVVSTVHTIDGAGYLVELDTRPPEPDPPTGGCEVTVGVVDSADDPEGRGRVKVSLPAYSNVELDWRPVVTPGAGSHKGLVALPDEGDRVLLLLPGGDPAAAVVVGGFHGRDGPADHGVVRGSVKRWSFATPGGQRVILDDDVGQVVLANRDGSSMVLAPDQVTVHSATDLSIEAPGNTITLTADRVDLRRARTATSRPDLPPPHPGGGR